MAETVQPQERRNYPKGKPPNHHPERNKRHQTRLHMPDTAVLLFVIPHVALSLPLLSTKLKVGASSPLEWACVHKSTGSCCYGFGDPRSVLPGRGHRTD